MSESLDTLKKPLDNVSGFIKFFVQIVNMDSIGLVGNTGDSVLRINVCTNFFRAKSLVSQNFFVGKSDFAQ